MIAIAETEDDFVILPQNGVWTNEDSNNFALVIQKKAKTITSYSNELTFLFRLFYFYSKIFPVLIHPNRITILHSYEETLCHKSISIFSYEKVIFFKWIECNEGLKMYI